MKCLIYFVMFLYDYKYVDAEIRTNPIVNKLIRIKPVGAVLAKNFVPLTDMPPPRKPATGSGRRHMEDNECNSKSPVESHGGPSVDIHGDYYDNMEVKTVATVIIPDHIDIKHFEVTTQVPYLTVGTIEAIGYHPSTLKSEHPSECEKIYQEHLDEHYSEGASDYSEESLEMARMPLAPPAIQFLSAEALPGEKMYSDLELS